ETVSRRVMMAIGLFRSHPVVWIAPLCLLFVLVGVTEFAVAYAAKQQASAQQNIDRQLAGLAVEGIAQMFREGYWMVLALKAQVLAAPFVPDLRKLFNQTAAELIARVDWAWAWQQGQWVGDESSQWASRATGRQAAKVPCPCPCLCPWWAQLPACCAWLEGECWALGTTSGPALAGHAPGSRLGAPGGGPPALLGASSLQAWCP
ncbi:hypothetical protein HaLaN_22671, partial [Haematococcus lacustris]